MVLNADKCYFMCLGKDTENQLKALYEMMKNAFYFTSTALFVLKIFKFLTGYFGHASKRLDEKDKVSFKFYDVTA